MVAAFAQRISRLPDWAVRLPLLVYWCALMLALHYPDIPMAHKAPRGADKFVHVLLYGVLAGLARLVAGRQVSASGRLSSAWRRSLLVFVLVVVQAIVDEITQPLTGRTADLLDFGCDLLGGACALVLFHVLLARHTEPDPAPEPAPVC